jgi:hypothetical protein
VADIALSFAVENGLSLDDAVGIFTGSNDPSILGEAAPIGSLYIRQNGSLYQKIGSANTDWVTFAQGVGETVKISSTDGTIGFLSQKLVVSSNLTSVVQNPGGNETQLLDLSDTGISAGSYRTVVVDAKGRVTAGSNPVTLSGYGIVDAQPLNAALTALTQANYPGVYFVTGAGTSIVYALNGTAGQITVTNGSGVAGAPVFSLPSTGLTFPGTEGVFFPAGTTAQRVIALGATRFNTDTATVEYYNGIAWVSLVASTLGTVTSISVTAPTAGITVSGSPITTAGTITLALSDDLAGLEGLGGIGYAVRTGLSTWETRGVYGTLNRVTVTNGLGTTGDTEIDIAATYAGQTSITTLGVIGTGTWQGTKISTEFGGTGRSTIGTGSQLLGVNTTATGLEYKSLIGGTGIGLNFAGGEITITNTGVVSVTGTANQIITSAAAGTITLSLPQSIAVASSPTFAAVTVTDPITSSTQLTTKAYVDGAVQGLTVKGSVKAATTANIILSGEQTLDGVAVVTGDRVLVKNQTIAAANGIYVVDAGAWVRALDLDTWTEVPDAFTFVEEGDTLADTGWVCTSNRTGTLETTAITWVQFSAAGITTASTGLVKVGNDIRIDQVTTTGTFNSVTVTAQGLVSTGSNHPYLIGNQDITLQGDVTAGPAPNLLTTSLSLTGVTAGTYQSLTVDAKGRVTAGSNPTTLAEYFITDAQPLNIFLSDISALNTNGLMVRYGNQAMTRAIEAGSNKVSVVNGDGLLGNPTIDVNLANININSIGGSPLSIAGGGTNLTTLGTHDQLLSVNQAGSGLEYRTLTASGITITPGDGGLHLATINNGTVTSVTVTGSTGISAAGSPVTSSGTISLTLDTELQGLTFPTDLGIVTRTATGTYLERSIVSGVGTITITNPKGTAGNFGLDLSSIGTSGTYHTVTTDAFGRVTAGEATVPWSAVISAPTTLLGYGITDAQPLNAYLLSLASNGTTGIVIKSGSTSYVRSIVAGSTKVSVTNGNGFAGNPTIDIGILNLDDLADVTVPTPAAGDALVYNGSGWVNGSITPKLYAENPVSQVTPISTGINAIALGSEATAQAHDSIAIGRQSLARLPGIVQANGRFATQGDAQAGTYVLRTSTINGTPGIEMFLNGVNGGERLVMTTDSTWVWEATIVAHRTDASNQAGFKLKGVLYCGGSINSIVMLGAPSKEILARSDTNWDVAAEADVANGSLKITVKGAAGQSIRWMALVQTTEVTN